MSRLGGIEAMRIAWAVRRYGSEFPQAYGARREDDSYGTRVFYGPQAERKAMRDLERGAGLDFGDDGHDAEALRLQRARGRAQVDPARDCPPCPSCSMPCGTGEDAPGKGWLRCGACGEPWQASADELAQSKRADAAYRAERETEERDAYTFERMPESVRAVNRRMLEQLEARRQAPAGEQLSLLGGES